MSHLVALVKENKRIFFFCGKLIVLLVFFTYLDIHLFSNSGFHQWIIDVLGTSSTALMRNFGMPYAYRDSFIYLGGEIMLEIDHSCNGLSFMTMFISFVLAYPTNKPLEKVGFIMLGIAIIHVLNTIRVILLIINFDLDYSSFDFNHKYTFAGAVYAIVLVMWIYWAKKHAVRD